MADQIGICNGALTAVGSDSISDITEPNKRARTLNAIWDATRQEVLAAHNWNPATMRATLAPNGNTPAHTYDYEYDCPNDCLRVVGLEPDDIDFVVENKKVLCDEGESIDVVYIFDQTDYSAWTPLMASAMEWKLAAKVAYAFTQSTTLADKCEKKFLAVLAEARSFDGAEGKMKALVSTSWIDARRGR
jgi:hypothetical protein